MRKTRRLSVLALLLTLGVLGSAGSAAAAFPTNTAGQTEQATSSRGLDLAGTNHGGWDNVSSIGRVNGRPYIKSLQVSNDNGVTFDPLVVPDSANGTNGWAPLAASISGQVSDVYAFISPTNGCGTSQTPETANCYDPPNRVSVYLARWDGTGWDPNFTTIRSTNPVITATSVIDIVIGFKDAYSSLRWTWVDGVPSYWSNTVVDRVGGDVHVRFTPKTVPIMSDHTGCSQIPVETCDIPKASEEDLEASLILSMDTSLSASLAGTLFGTENAFIGSLYGTPPNLTYGVAAPHLNADGSERRGTFYALMPDSVLSLFGTSVASFDPGILAVTRTGDAGTFSPAWSTWTATDNGTSGKLLTISNISFSAPKFQVSRAGANSSNTNTNPNTNNNNNNNNASKGSNAPTIRVGKTISFAGIASGYALKTSGSKLSAKVSTPKVCKVVGKTIKGLKAGTCRGTLTIKPKKGKSSKKRFSFAVTGGKRLPISLHH